jgi:multidrug efflux pump subunit AcrA (membrane-fusion protein)
VRAWTVGPLALVGVGVLAAAAWGLSGSRPGAMAVAGAGVPTTAVVRGNLDLDVHLEGELRAVREMSLTAPAVGGTLRILDVVETGTPVRAGDVIMSFDPAEQQFLMEQATSEVLEAEQEIIKRRADAEVAAAQDEVAQLTARFDVRRAELAAAVGPDLIGANEHQIRQVSLEEAKRQLTQAVEDAKSRGVTSRAALAVLEEKRTKAQLTADRARQNMDSLFLKAPIDGFVSVRSNDEMGGFFGMEQPPYRIGDSVFAGRPVIDVLDVSGMEIRARVNEQERSNVTVGQEALVQFDGVAGLSLPAKVTIASSLGRADRTAGPLRLFDVTLRLDRTDPRLRPGTTVDVVVKGRTVEGVLLVPRQCIFDKAGKNIVHVAAAAGFEEREVTVLHRTESRAAIEGVDEGAVVALVDPAAAARGSSPARAGAAAPAGARR